MPGANMKPSLHILLPYDFSRYSEETLNFALGLDSAYRCSYLLLHVVPVNDADGLLSLWDDPGEWFARREADVIQALTEVAARVKVRLERDCCDTLVSSGVPFREICRIADERNAQMIVIGTHGRTGLSHLLMGSTAERVVQHAACPVLSIKPKFH